MPALTRKCVNDRPVTWHVHYAGVRVGMIVERSGVANTAEPWEWHCGFYPGSDPGEQRYGGAASFEAARAAFEAAWREYVLPAQRSRLPRMARSGSLDRAQICDVGKRRAEAVADAKLTDDVPLRRDFRRPPPRTHSDPCAAHHSGASASPLLEQRAGSGLSMIQYRSRAGASGIGDATGPQDAFSIWRVDAR
jgi:hypothetical protein